MGLATKIYIAVEAIDMRKGFEGLYGLVRDQLGQDPLSGHLFLFTNKTQNAIESAGVGRQRIVGVRETAGEGPFPLAGSVTRTAACDDASRRVGDAGERAGCEANAAAQLVSQKRVKMFSTFSRIRVIWNISLMAAARSTGAHRDAGDASCTGRSSRLKSATQRFGCWKSACGNSAFRLLGPHSETLSDLQLELLAEQEPCATGEEVEAESRPRAARPSRRAKRKPHPGRKPLPENLPRIEEVIACAEPNCKSCGGETSVIGYDESEVLDREPARWFVRVTKREKRACGKCSSVAMPELAPRIVEKGLASDAVVIDTVVAKYCDHLPLYRQEAMLEREAGVEISRATLDGWVMRVGELLQPAVAAMRQDLLRASYLQADETTVPVQMHD